MRWRNMYYATGLPGWMRFGYSPGWAGRSATGLGPCAEYLMTGQWPTPQMAAAWPGMQGGGPAVAPFGYPPNPEQQLEFLRQHAQMLEQQGQALQQQLEAIRQQIAELEQGSE